MKHIKEFEVVIEYPEPTQIMMTVRSENEDDVVNKLRNALPPDLEYKIMYIKESSQVDTDDDFGSIF